MYWILSGYTNNNELSNMAKKKIIPGILVLVITIITCIGYWFVGLQIEPAYSKKSERFKKEILSDTINEMRASRDRANANVKDETGTPLFFHAQSVSAAEYLVKHRRANIDATNMDGENILHYLIKKIIGSNSDQKVPLLKYYLRKGVNPNQPDNKTGSTPKDLMGNKTCKGKNIFWDQEVLLLVHDSKNELLAANDYDYNHIFTNPKVSITPRGSDNKYSSYKHGYEFYAENKSVINGALVLSYRGSILNRSISLTLSDTEYDFDTCEKDAKGWACKNRATDAVELFASPLTAYSYTLPNINYESSATYASYPDYKNLQPDGRIILGYLSQVPDNFTINIEYPQNYDFDSLKIYYGSWVGDSNLK